MRLVQKGCIEAIICFACLLALPLSLFSAAATPPENATSPVRPLVTAVLQGGEQVEGVLERFDDGVYWLLVGQVRRTFAEKDT